MSLISPLRKIMRSRLALLLIAVFVFSLVFYALNFHGRSYSFVYHISGSDDTSFETRAVPNVNGLSKIQLYTQELLLGPSVPRATPLFPLETRILFCFQRGEELFVNLSQDALLNLSPDADYRESYELMQRNIRDNFPLVKKLNLFIGGEPVFSDTKIQ